MKINRHNYEEYFILYMDNELTQEQRRLVEEFVKLHPDLKEELDNLLQYKMTPDEAIVFPAKEELLKGSERLHMADYREMLLLYVDNELNVADRKSVEELVSGNELLKKELQYLQQTKLGAETISFPDKSSLYRRSERRIAPVWWRMAAAVLVLALVLSAVLIISRRSSGVPEVAVTKPGKITSPVVKEELAQNKDQIKKQPEEIVQPSNNSIEQPKDQIAVIKNDPSPVIVKNDKEESIVPKANDAIADNNINNIPINPSNNLPKPERTDATPIKALTETGVTSVAVAPSEYKTASYPTTNEGFEQDGKDGKKNKLRGFFRKIARTFEKRTNIDPTTDDNKLLVGGLSINLK